MLPIYRDLCHVHKLIFKFQQFYPSYIVYIHRDTDDAIIRPLPRVKRLLSDSVCLPHVVQLLLTFDPVLVEKVATLLCEVMRDNPNISTLYLTGVFYFILMYTGSNVLPVARFLQLTHTKQALKGSDVSGTVQVIVYRSDVHRAMHRNIFLQGC